jgi:SAM-dependent methyltransferase
MDVCRICRHSEGNQAFTVREMMFGLRRRFEYFQCARCRCLQIREIPADMTPYYPANYYSMEAELESGKGFGRRALAAIEGGFRRHVNNTLFGPSRRARIFDWLRGTDTSKRSAIVDVGAGRGKLLHELHLFGYRDLTGADPYIAKDLEYDNGIVIHKRELRELERSFDLVMMHHTFEHVAEPEGTMADAFERLRPGRFLLLRIPVADCYAWRHYGVNWFALDAPRHFYLHTEKSIGLLAQRTGFTVERVQYDSGAHQFWGSEQYLRDIPHRSPTSYEENPKASVFSPAEIAEYTRRSHELNAQRDGDSACFYLRRR